MVTDLNSLKNYFSELLGNTDTLLEVHLAGGAAPPERRQEKEMQEAIGSWNTRFLTSLATIPKVIIKSANIGNSSSSDSLAIDARTGDIFTDFAPDQLTVDFKTWETHFNKTQKSGSASIPLKKLESIKTPNVPSNKTENSGTGKIAGYALFKYFEKSLKDSIDKEIKQSSREAELQSTETLKLLKF